MKLHLDDGRIATLTMLPEQDTIVITSEINGKKSTEIVFFPDGRKYTPDAGQFKELR